MINESEILQELKELKEKLLDKYHKRYIANKLEISIRQLERLFSGESKITYIQYKKLKELERL